MALRASVPLQECSSYSPRDFTSAVASSSSQSADASPVTFCRGGGRGVSAWARAQGCCRDGRATGCNASGIHRARATPASLGRALARSVCGAGASEVELTTMILTGAIRFGCDGSRRKSPSSSALTVRAKSRTKDGKKEVFPQKELLGQVRNRKKLTRLLREQELSQQVSESPNAWPFWKKKRKSDTEARALTNRIMLLSRRQQLDQVFALLEQAKKEGTTLCTIIMNAVMEACVRCDNIDRAFAVYREILQPGNCGVDNITYGILLKGLGQAHRLDDAFELTEAIEAGTAPGNPVLSDVHLHTLVNACVEAGDSLRARAVFQRYRAAMHGSGPSILTYNLLIKGYARSANPLDALGLKDEMLVHELQPQRLTYNSLLFACVRGGDMERAMELFKEMKVEARRLGTSRLLPDVVTYTTLLQGLADSGNTESISRLVEEMFSSPTCVLDRVAYSAIIDAFIVSGSPEAVTGLDAMNNLRDESILLLYWQMMTEDGLLFFNQEMAERAKSDPLLRPKAHVYLALMRAFAERGNMEVVRSLRRQMVREAAGKVSPEDRAEADELLIETAVNSGQLGFAKEMLRTMIGIKKGIPLSKRAYMAIVRLQALLGFTQDLFKPFLLKSGLSLQNTVDSIMLPYEQARPLHGDSLLGSVIMRFLVEDSLPVIDNNGACIGVVHSADCIQTDVRLRDIMRADPPEVTNSTPIGKAVSLLLQQQVQVVVVVSSKAAYSTKIETARAIPLGFVTRGAIFSRSNPFPSAERQFGDGQPELTLPSQSLSK